MTGTIQDWQECAPQDVAPSAIGAPPLPIEQHIVAAALAAQHLKSLAEQMLLVLQYAPRDASMVQRLQTDIALASIDIDNHHGAYVAVSECRGQG